MYANPPFALFCLVDTKKETIDTALDKCHTNVGGVWYFWVASKGYEKAPQKKDGEASEGSEAPLSSVPQDFTGKKLEDATEWLRAKPDNVDLDGNFFAVIDRGLEEDGSLVLVRFGGPDLKGDETYIGRLPAEKAALHLGGMESGLWEDLFGSEKKATEIKY